MPGPFNGAPGFLTRAATLLTATAARRRSQAACALATERDAAPTYRSRAAGAREHLRWQAIPWSSVPVEKRWIVGPTNQRCHRHRLRGRHPRHPRITFAGQQRLRGDRRAAVDAARVSGLPHGDQTRRLVNDSENDESIAVNVRRHARARRELADPREATPRLHGCSTWMMCDLHGRSGRRARPRRAAGFKALRASTSTALRGDKSRGRDALVRRRDAESPDRRSGGPKMRRSDFRGRRALPGARATQFIGVRFGLKTPKPTRSA